MVWTSYDESNETPWDTRRECSSCGLALEGGNSEVNTLDIVFNGYRKHILRLNIHSLILQDRHSNHYQQASCQLQGIEMLTEPEIGNDACCHESSMLTIPTRVASTRRREPRTREKGMAMPIVPTR